MSTELVHYAVDDAVATITLDSPHNRNALSSALVQQLGDHLAAAAADDAVRAVLLTHTGGTFCAGADLSEASGGSPKDSTATLVALLKSLVALPKPVVARIDGHVRAGGLGLVGACDIVIAGPQTSYAFTEVRLGLAPAMISLTVLPRIAQRAASRYFLTGEKFDAATAERIGLVTVATDDTEATTAGVLDALRKGSPQGLRESKALTTVPVLRALDEDADRLADLSARLFASDEAREGMLSFLERRPPRWATPTPAEETP
ncbi:enoyl-CoA hydratase family protein [Luteipulveratus halotolerans]|uniref:Enoyl-CoA hydratase n=1 Tax=Luteipulveratus halotolerans TaxID=1631356 RepID=A0A0L6CKV8_9MICO|nr:enoyl-CoA hydratase family protein [Luteipulveratus halotolerans]KNX38431.1 enoyl-CoA hydratase [Luteipulveratus halotolerans]